MNDSFYGDGGDASGQNQLGKILMEVREELRPSDSGCCIQGCTEKSIEELASNFPKLCFHHIESFANWKAREEEMLAARRGGSKMTSISPDVGRKL